MRIEERVRGDRGWLRRLEKKESLQAHPKRESRFLISLAGGDGNTLGFACFLFTWESFTTLILTTWENCVAGGQKGIEIPRKGGWEENLICWAARVHQHKARCFSHSYLIIPTTREVMRSQVFVKRNQGSERLINHGPWPHKIKRRARTWTQVGMAPKSSPPLIIHMLFQWRPSWQRSRIMAPGHLLLQPPVHT